MDLTPTRPERDLGRLLAGLRPRRKPGEFVMVSLAAGTGDPLPAGTEAIVREDEGISAVLPRERADALDLGYDFVAGWITLDVHSDLAAVGLTAAVSTALTTAGISCNVLAGYHHDHLLVPLDRVAQALAVLHGLAA